MKNETKQWLEYANENFISAKILLESELYNPTLQNSQQSIEKYLKAYLIEKNYKLQKTHSISVLVQKIHQDGITLDITDDEIDLIDTIYLSSKYPLGSVLPDFEPDKNICLQCIDIASRVKEDIDKYLKNT